MYLGESAEIRQDDGMTKAALVEQARRQLKPPDCVFVAGCLTLVDFASDLPFRRRESHSRALTRVNSRHLVVDVPSKILLILVYCASFAQASYIS